MSGVNNRSVPQSPRPSPNTKEPIFPVEILNIIIGNVSDVRTLFRLLTVSRTKLEIAEAALYHTLDLSDMDSFYISPLVYHRLSTLYHHLYLDPYHASLVHKYKGKSWKNTVHIKEASKVMSVTLSLDHMPNLFTRLRELDLSCDPSPSAMPMDREQFHAAVQCSTQELRVLILDSQTLHALASHPYGLFTLQMLVQRQKQLKIFRVLPFYSQSRPPHPKIINNVLLPLSQSVECVEGSFWTLNSMLPAHVRPKKLRFIENADLFNQDLPVRESLLQRLQHVRVLSYRYKSGDEPRKYSVFIPIFADLPLLEVLGLEFDDAVQAEWLHWAISTFSLGCLNIKKLIIAVRLMTVRPRDLIGQSTFQDIESLDYIRLEMARGVCWQKKRGDPDWQRVSVAENDWWIYE